jgi:hypothetical protein
MPERAGSSSFKAASDSSGLNESPASYARQNSAWIEIHGFQPRLVWGILSGWPGVRFPLLCKYCAKFHQK